MLSVIFARLTVIGKRPCVLISVIGCTPLLPPRLAARSVNVTPWLYKKSVHHLVLYIVQAFKSPSRPFASSYMQLGQIKVSAPWHHCANNACAYFNGDLWVGAWADRWFSGNALAGLFARIVPLPNAPYHRLALVAVGRAVTKTWYVAHRDAMHSWRDGDCDATVRLVAGRAWSIGALANGFVERLLVSAVTEREILRILMRIQKLTCTSARISVESPRPFVLYARARPSLLWHECCAEGYLRYKR